MTCCMMLKITWSSTSGRSIDAPDTVFSREREIDLKYYSLYVPDTLLNTVWVGGVTRNLLGLRTFFKSTLQTLLPNRTRAVGLIEFPVFFVR